jgi:class 3 adenylate cyclase
MIIKKAATTARAGYYNTIILLMRLLGICVVILILIFLLPFAVPYIKDAESFKFIRISLDIEKSIASFVRGIMPTKIAGMDVTLPIMIVAAIILGSVIRHIRYYYSNRLATMRVKMDIEEWRSEMNLPDNAKVLTPLKGKLEKLETSNKKDREELLKLFAETKKKLDSMGRDLAFLSIDVVDSTGMKLDEEKAAAEHDFMEYKRFVDSKLTANGALKSAWTPDGVMTCFPNVDAAVRAAREVIHGLDAFNRNVKTMRQNFRVRCGINHGYVYFDESVPMEAMSDRAIDIAGHMQKNAPPDSICVAKPSVEPMHEREGFAPAGRVVDGYEVYVWEKKV